MRRRESVLAAAVTAVLLATALAASAAGAGEAPPEPVPQAGPPEPRLRLAGIDQPWVPAGGAMALRLEIANAPPGVEVSVVAHQAISSRIGFEETLAGEGLGPFLGRVAAPLEVLPIDANGSYVFLLALQVEGAPTDPSRLELLRTGVYPLLVELRDDADAVLSSFVMPLPVVAPGPGGTPAVGERLEVAWVWPVVARPATLPSGTPDPEVVEQLEPGGRLARQASALAAASDVAVTLVPGPETLESWTSLAANDANLAGTLVPFEAALGAAQVLPSPYVPINVPSLLAGGLGAEVGPELVHGTDVLDGLLGTRLDPRTALTGPINDEALVRLSDARVDRMIVPADALAPRDSQYTPAHPFLLEAQGRTATAVASDPGLEAILRSDAPEALRAQQFLGGLAVIALEQPNLRRGIAVVNPTDWSPSAELLATTLSGLRGHPLVQPVRVDQLMETVPIETADDAPVQRAFAPLLPPPPPITADDLVEARRRLDAFSTLVVGGSLRVVQGQRAILLSLSSAWEEAGGRARARAQLDVIDTSIAEVLSSLHVPVSNTVTLTAREGTIPVTFRNDSDQTLRVRVRLESNRLFFPDGPERELELPPGNTPVLFDVESPAAGTFPLELTVTSVDGQLVIQEARVRIRSTVVSGVGVVLTAGAGLFLIGWWALHWRRRRHRRAASRGEEGSAEIVHPAAGPASPA